MDRIEIAITPNGRYYYGGDFNYSGRSTIFHWFLQALDVYTRTDLEAEGAEFHLVDLPKPKPRTKVEHVGRTLERLASTDSEGYRDYRQEMMDAADALLGRRGADGSPYNEWGDV